MIFVFTGKTGTGKTFNMVKIAYSYWLGGFDIYSNTILFFSEQNTEKRLNIINNSTEFSFQEKIIWFLMKLSNKIFKSKFKPLERGKIIYFQNISEILEVQNGIILFDEGQVLFNARQWEQLPEEFQYKLQQHRKHNLHLFTTTQSMGSIDITYRRLVQVWLHHTEVFKLSFFGIYRQSIKDVDMLYNKVDDLTVASVSDKIFIIHKWSKTLYDTLFDIGFKRFKTIWASSINCKQEQGKTKIYSTKKFLILPKKMLLSDGQRVISLLKSASGQVKFKNFKKI